MKITYKFADGTLSEVEVSDEIGTFIIDSRRAEETDNRRERYHREFSLDGMDFENDKWGMVGSSEDDLIVHHDLCEFNRKLSCLTPTQRRRMLAYAEGLSYREIARREGVQIKAVIDSIEQARKKLLLFFK